MRTITAFAVVTIGSFPSLWIQAKPFPFAGIQVGRYAINGESTTLGQVKKMLGSARIDEAADDHVGFAYSCYSIGRGSEENRVILKSDVEMGGSEHRVLNFLVIARGGEPRLERHCSSVPEAVGVSTDRGVRLGMSRAEVETKIGKPTKESPGKLIYEAHGTGSTKACPVYDKWSQLELRFANGRVVRIEGYRGDTC